MFAPPFFRRPFYRATAIKIRRIPQNTLSIWGKNSTRSLSSSRSASIVVNIDNSSTPKCGPLPIESLHLHDYNVNGASSSNKLTVLLEDAIERKDAAQALTYFNQFVTLPSKLLAQKVAILLAKQQSKSQAKKAYDILQLVFRYADLPSIDNEF